MRLLDFEELKRIAQFDPDYLQGKSTLERARVPGFRAFKSRESTRTRRVVGLLLGVRNDAVVASQGDTALGMVTLGRFEDRAGELGVGGAGKDAFDGIVAAVVP
ncbi:MULTISPECIES: hypothetical protein [unclassified Bradyrhizobium]